MNKKLRIFAKRIWLVNLALAVVFAGYLRLTAKSIIQPVYAQETPTITDGDFEDYDEGGGNFQIVPYNLNYLYEQELFFGDGSKKLVLSPQDLNELNKCYPKKNEDCQVDTRVINYLAYLVAPIELGGAGFNHIKVTRILKNYNTSGVGKYDRETLAAAEEENWLISDHNSGQAVDISEVGQVTCKLVERRHIGGSTTKWQDPRGIKVAWQSKDGIARNPTPKGTSLIGVSGGLSANAILEMLNATGEMDDYLQFVKGLDFETIISYVGMNIYLKNNGYLNIIADPLSNSFISVIGGYALQKAFPDLPDGWMMGSDGEDIRVNVAKAQIEKSLDLPNGSLKGYGWNNILEGVGKRMLEDAAGLPNAYLDKKSLSEANSLEVLQALYKKYKRSDDSFNFVNGTIEQLQKGDKKGLRLAGINLLSDAFKLSESQKQTLIDSVKNNKPISINSDYLPVDREIDSETLKNLFSENREDQKKAEASLLNIGLEIVGPILSKKAPKQLVGVTDKLINDLRNSSKKVTAKDAKEEAGKAEVAVQSGVDPKEADKLEKPSNQKKIADYLNKEYGLEDNEKMKALKISESDVADLLKSKSFDVVNKIGSIQADKALLWNPGTALQVIKGQMKLESALEQTFATALSSSLGLDESYKVAFDAHLENSYGSALLEQRLNAPKDLLLNRNSFDNFPAYELEAWFGVDKSRSLSELRNDAAYWNEPKNIEKWLEIDRKMGVPLDTTKKALKGEMDFRSYKKKIFQENMISTSIDSIWNFFDLEGDFRLSSDDANTLQKVLRNWSGSSIEDQQKAKELALKIAGRSFDMKAGFSIDAMYRLFTVQSPGQFADILIDEGVRHLALAMVGGLEDGSMDDVKKITQFLKTAFNDPREVDINRFGEFMSLALRATGIPEEYKIDIKHFITGDYRLALNSWSAAVWTKFSNQYLPEGGKLTYLELRDAFWLNDQSRIDDFAFGLYKNEWGQLVTKETFDNLSDFMKQDYRDNARKQIMQENQRNSFYKMSDAMIIKAGIDIPKDFSKVMFSGTQEERSKLILNFGLSMIEKEFQKIEASYPLGLLSKVLNGEVSATQADSIVLGIINRSGVSFGSFTNEFIGNFYQFLKGAKSTDFYTSERFGGMWSFFDRWLSNEIGISNLPQDLSKSIYYASQHNWDFNSSLIVDDKVVVPSLSAVGEDFLVGRLSLWGDKNFGLKPGTTLRIYRVTTDLIKAHKALAQGIKDGVDLTKFKHNLAQAQAAIIVLAITIALDACDECQKFFAQIDRAIAAPPGFTNMLVAGALAMAFGLGPAGVLAALAVYFFGVYRVDFLCPLPPPDRYSVTSFDPEYDQIEYKWGDYYSDPSKPVMDTPAPGQTNWEWQDSGVQWIDGNDENSWMFWARYNVGRLLDATLDYGERQTDAFKPKQVITLRQANVEFFGVDKDRMIRAFGEMERGNNYIGLGFSQKSTKTTDWVHASFGGLF